MPAFGRQMGFRSAPETGAGSAGAAALTSGRWSGRNAGSRAWGLAVRGGGERPGGKAAGLAPTGEAPEQTAGLLGSGTPIGSQMLLGACRGRRARWAGGWLLAAFLSKAPSNRAVCNWVEAHTPRAGAAWANGFRQP